MSVRLFKTLRFAAASAVAFVALGSSADAQGGEDCLTADPPAPGERTERLIFGITPQLAGNAGVAQGDAEPLDRGRVESALATLRPQRRELVLHLNRLFWEDRRKGIRRFARLVDRYARAGFTSEVQVRYHPDERQEGKIARWGRFVRRAVRTLGRRESVVAFTITNEANLPISPNTSDGAYDRVIPALVRGVTAADRQLRRLGRPGVPVGFSVMWRWNPEDDVKFWERVGKRATPAFRRALDYVGLQVYPGLVWPPTMLPGRSAGMEVAEALTLVRRCFMPKADLGRRYELWISENGYPTKPVVNSESGQVSKLASTVRWVHRYSRRLNVSDYRYFNLRDNDSAGTDLFDQVGLLRDDYSRKPAFGAYRDLIRRFGE